ncbi:M23 family metallopeptidase [Xylanimonas allomyrinae]|uniref:M23 family metallopeptidase n=2 Tax=Xylanimonas allomyrinae TaxID=2509459 RepID=A0A4P6F370_9MICO|nr:M23 family metallopeptidase [Xylanimonas allomyrinae]
MAAAQATPTCGRGQTVTAVPDMLAARTTDGTPITMGRVQLEHAATLIDVGATVAGVGRDGVVVALMAALTESGLRNYANTTAYPASGTLPHDADGSDHDSLGIFQMRPAAGWGSVAELMDVTYQARAFYGGPTGPNHGTPRGLLDLPRWRDLSPGQAAQGVEVSAFPDRYARYEPVAEAILDALTTASHAPTATSGDTVAAGPAPVPSVGVVRYPLPDNTGVRTSGFGMRTNPVLHVRRLHEGVDLAAPQGTPILATAAGRVVAAGPRGGLGNAVAIEHHLHAQAVVSVYGHIAADGTHVRVGDLVAAGDWIADVGSTGNSTGPHLHFEIRPGGLDHPAIDPTAWLASATGGTTPSLPAGLAACTTPAVRA